MGKKLYEETETGGIRFKSERKPWEVRVPNYVYDLWMPVLGVVDIGIYSVYCRLERENIVKAITLGTIARACRIGKTRLYDVNERLFQCGFIRITPPEGWQRLAHYTTEITVLDPPQEVPAWAIEDYCQVTDGYQPLSPWLVEDDGESHLGPSDVPNGTMGGAKQDADDVPNGTPNVETLDLKLLDVDALDVESDSSPKKAKRDPLLLEQERITEEKRAQAGGDWGTPAHAGGDDRLADAALFALYSERGKRPPKKGTKQWQQQCSKVAEALAAYGYEKASLELVEKAAALFCERKGDWTNVFYPSFAMDFGQALSDAEGAPVQAAKRTAPRHQPESALLSQEALRERQGARATPPQVDLVGAMIKTVLSAQMGRNEFRQYVAPCGFTCDDGALVITAPDVFTRDWLENRLGLTIERALAGAADGPGEVRFEIISQEMKDDY